VSSPTQVQRQIGLPGGVVLTAETSVASKWSIPNMHGDIAWVTDQTGAVTGGPFRYDPFGKPVGARVGVNVIENADYGWLGSHQRLNEESSGLTWMGARIYQPTTGRFLSADPVEGGTDNDYTYPADPVNQVDLDGRCKVGPFRVGIVSNKRNGCRGAQSVRKYADDVATVAGGATALLGTATAIAPPIAIVTGPTMAATSGISIGFQGLHAIVTCADFDKYCGRSLTVLGVNVVSAGAGGFLIRFGAKYGDDAIWFVRVLSNQGDWLAFLVPASGEFEWLDTTERPGGS
jgi:RHS repeat-associated protein